MIVIMLFPKILLFTYSLSSNYRTFLLDEEALMWTEKKPDQNVDEMITIDEFTGKNFVEFAQHCSKKLI